MAMTIEKPISNGRNFLIWAAAGALFYLAVVLAAAAFRDAGDVSVLVRPEKAAPAGLGLIFTAVVVGLANWNQPASLRNMIKFAIIAAGAAAIAYFGFRMGIRLRDEGGLGEIRASELVAAMIGFLYVLLAIVIGIGLPSPRFGALFLNVEDAEDLREQRRMLAYATAGLATMGVPLVLLALAGPGGILPSFVALAIALILFVSAALFAIAQWRHMDELARRLSQECSAMTCYLIMAIGGGWAVLAHLGFAADPAPLDWLSMFYALVLVAGFIVAGRRGLLKPR